MAILLSYVLLGLSLAAPIGPVNAAQLDRGLKGGFLKAWFFGLGSVSGDLFYVVLVYFGLVALINIPVIRIFLWLFGAFVLFYTALEGFKGIQKLTPESAMRSVETHRQSFFSGFLMSISNPMTILFWVGIYGSVFAEASAQSSIKEMMVYTGAVLLGLVLWDLFMACLSSGFRSFLSSRLLKGISLGSSLTLLGFGCFFGYQGLKVLIVG